MRVLLTGGLSVPARTSLTTPSRPDAAVTGVEAVASSTARSSGVTATRTVVAR